MKERRASFFDFECAIIGAGPGGLVASLYLKRYRRNILIVDNSDSRAKWAPRIRNLVGYANGISGRRLLIDLRKQIACYNPPYIVGEAEIRRKSKGFEIKVGKRILTAKSVILATGMKDIQPQFPNLEILRKKGLLAYCPICDGFDHSKHKVGLLVQDNHGLKKVAFLKKFTPHLQVFTTRAFRPAAKHIESMRKLKVPFHREPVQSLESKNGLAVHFESRKTSRVHLAYVALGTYLNNAAFKHLKNLKRSKEGFILTSSHQETSVPGLYAVGDCVQALSQVSVAVGHAAVAATQIHNRLLKEDIRLFKKNPHIYHEKKDLQ